jgi:branched-chain amino acid transport system substrate-binding protein
VGEIRFGKNGEWWKPRNLYVQFRNIKGNTVQDFSGPGKMIVVYPKEWVSGPLVYPFPGWK